MKEFGFGIGIGGEMTFEEIELGVDAADQAGPACPQDHDADAARGVAPDAIGFGSFVAGRLASRVLDDAESDALR